MSFGLVAAPVAPPAAPPTRAPTATPGGPPSTPMAAPVAAPVAAPPVVRSGCSTPQAASRPTTAKADRVASLYIRFDPFGMRDSSHRVNGLPMHNAARDTV